MAVVGCILTFLILCGTGLLGYHMYLCNKNGIKMYADPRYDERIKKLEEELKEIKEKE